MTNELNNLIAEARTRDVSDEERVAQRVSFAYGNLALDQPGASRELVQQINDVESLTKQRDQWMKNYHRVSHQYDRLLVTATMYRTAALVSTTLLLVVLALLWSR